MGRRPKQQPKINIVYRDAKGVKKWTGVIELNVGDGVQNIMQRCREWRKENPRCKFIAVEVGPGVRR